MNTVGTNNSTSMYSMICFFQHSGCISGWLLQLDKREIGIDQEINRKTDHMTERVRERRSERMKRIQPHPHHKCRGLEANKHFRHCHFDKWFIVYYIFKKSCPIIAFISCNDIVFCVTDLGIPLIWLWILTTHYSLLMKLRSLVMRERVEKFSTGIT